MKNKEIENILDKCAPYLFRDELDKLLSYIEQLEKRNKQLYEGFMATQEELTDYATENEQLENNRDKAINFLKEYHNFENRFKWCEQDYVDTINELENILKGDSDV